MMGKDTKSATAELSPTRGCDKRFASDRPRPDACAHACARTTGKVADDQKWAGRNHAPPTCGARAILEATMSAGVKRVRCPSDDCSPAARAHAQAHILRME
eukprot:5361783-Pyramimonas_sp.AAC.1